MSRCALILTYHGIGPEPSPLVTTSARFAEQLDLLREAGSDAVTIADLASRIRAGIVSGREVAITFDDGFRSVVTEAAPLLAERGMPATVFCVAGHLGGQSDWPSRQPGAPTWPLADTAELVGLAAAGFEIGCHGMTHAPLRRIDTDRLRREIVDSKAVLEESVGASVHSFALPYGASAHRAAHRLLEEAYAAVCTTSIGRLPQAANPYSLPRIDAHYLRSASVLRRVLEGRDHGYLRARAAGSRIRRTMTKDYAAVTA